MRDAVKPLHERLAACSILDRARLQRRLGELEHALAHGRHPHGRHAPARRLDELHADIDRAAQRLVERRAALPIPSFPDDLPIAGRRGDIADALRAHQVIVVCGETGSGKSTQLPKLCLQLGRGVEGMIAHTQPRRLAARSIAGRIAEELGPAAKHAVAFKVRFTDHTSPDTFIKVMTDGVLLAETQGDRFLHRYDTIIIDEAHERSLNIDFLLGYLRQLLPRRPELKVIITSATIDPERFARHFTLPGRPPVPVIEVSGRSYPVDVLYRPLASGDPDQQDRTLEQGILDAIDELASADPEGDPGDILVFLPGEREIRETAEELQKHHHVAGGRAEIVPLYARLSADEQHRVFEAHPGVRRIVLATNVAETSLTVPGIRYVVDTGLARISRYSSRSRVQSLPIEAVSRASANQRAGRCGRVAPGTCIRLYSEEDFASRDEFTPPEIVRTNLASVILRMKSLRLGDVDRFPFVEPPSPRAVQEGYDTLHELGAIDQRGRLTPVGEQLAKLPIDPRIGRMVLAGEKEACLREVLIVAAALSVQDPRERPTEARDAADAAHRGFVNAHLRPDSSAPSPTGPSIPGVPPPPPPTDDEPSGSDFMTLVNIWDEFLRQKARLSNSKLRAWCRTNYLGYMRLREWADVHAQLQRLVTQMGHRLNERPADEGSVHRALLTGLLVNIGRYDEEARQYRGAAGTLFSIFPGSAMFAAKARWVMAAERVRTTRLYARTVARIRPEWVEELGAHLVTRSHTDATWNPRTGVAQVAQSVFLFGLEVIPRRRVNLSQVDPPAARQAFIQHALIEGDYHLPHPFWSHNQRILTEARRLEDKARRRDLAADASRRFDFYDARLPPGITSGGAFDRWYAHARRDNPRALCMSVSDALRPGAAPPDPAGTPDTLVVPAGPALTLSYRFEPGEPDDGVTVHVPLPALGTLPEGAMEWLVPAWEREKIETLIRSLPKDLRRAVGPAPQAASAFLGASPDRSRSLLVQLREHLSNAAGMVVPADTLTAIELPDHLVMRVLVTDARGRPLAAGRNPAALRRQLRRRVASDLASVKDTPYNRRGMGEWEFGDLPERVSVNAGGVEVPAFPALVDDGASVALRLFSSREEADDSMAMGLRRLFMLRVKGEIKAALDHAPGMDRLASLWGIHGTAAELRDQLALCVARSVFLPPDSEPPSTIRTFQLFTARLHHGFGSIVTATLDTSTRSLPILESLQRLGLAIESMTGERSPEPWQRAAEGVRAQLGHLCPRGFLASTPPDRFDRLPLYLRAAELRLEKVRQGKGDQDARRAAELRPHLHRWLDAIAMPDQPSPASRRALDAYRWMLEDFRVTLFAQELAPRPVAVTTAKLDEQWAAYISSR